MLKKIYLLTNFLIYATTKIDLAALFIHYLIIYYTQYCTQTIGSFLCITYVTVIQLFILVWSFYTIKCGKTERGIFLMENKNIKKYKDDQTRTHQSLLVVTWRITTVLLHGSITRDNGQIPIFYIYIISSEHVFCTLEVGLVRYGSLMVHQYGNYLAFCRQVK